MPQKQTNIASKILLDLLSLSVSKFILAWSGWIMLILSCLRSTYACYNCPQNLNDTKTETVERVTGSNKDRKDETFVPNYLFYVPEAYILHFTNSCYFSHHTCLPVQFSKFRNCLQNIRGVYPKRPWNIVISTNNLAGLYTQSVCDENLRISCIIFL